MTNFTHPFWSVGFRPFFWLGSLYVVLLLVYWTSFWAFQMPVSSWAMIPSLWHGHEMLFGFASAIVAGFLLTASPVWTKSKATSGLALAGFIGTWLVGRVVFFCFSGLPLLYLAFLDLPFIFVLTINLAMRLIRFRAYRNLVFIPLLVLYGVCNVVFHRGLYLSNIELCRAALNGAGFVLLFLIVLIGGRVIPFFTQNRLPRSSVKKWKVVEGLTVILSLLVAVQFFLPVSSMAIGVTCFLTAFVHLIRFFGWRPLATLRIPLLWSLHLGYFWISVFFVLLGIHFLTASLPISNAFHALNVGAISGLILAMMSRVSLGHSGRPLEASPGIVAAYIGINLSTLSRLLAGLFGLSSQTWIAISGVLFCSSFLLFLLKYTNIIFSPRIKSV